jgi:hypothetical protein
MVVISAASVGPPPGGKLAGAAGNGRVDPAIELILVGGTAAKVACSVVTGTSCDALLFIPNELSSAQTAGAAWPAQIQAAIDPVAAIPADLVEMYQSYWML